MIPRYLVDTDWAIHFFNGHPAISRRVIDLFDEGLATSIVTIAELYEGVVDPPRPDRGEHDLQQFIAKVKVLGIDPATCRVFGQQRARLRKARNLIPDFDLMIGATALHHGLTLLTNNRRHFERIHGLKIESA